MNKIAKTALMTGTALCAAGVILSTAGYFAGGKDFTYASDHFYVSGGSSSGKNSTGKNLEVMKKKQIEDFTKLKADFRNLDLDIRTSGDDHYYMEYKLEKNGNKNPLTWDEQDGKLTLKESGGSGGTYYVNYDLGFLNGDLKREEKQDVQNTVILYVPEKAELSEAEIHLSDGDLTVEQMLCKKLDAKLSDGDMNLDKGSFEEFTAEFGDGDLAAGDLRAEQLKLKNSEGDVSADSAELGTADIELGDGDLTVKDISCTGRIDLDSGSGDVILEKTTLADGKISMGDGELTLNGSTFNGDMEISNSNGDVSVEMKSGGAKNTSIHLETSNGDVDASGISSGSSWSDEEEYSVYDSNAGEDAPALNVKCGDGDICLTEAEK